MTVLLKRDYMNKKCNHNMRVFMSKSYKGYYYDECIYCGFRSEAYEKDLS